MRAFEPPELAEQGDVAGWVRFIDAHFNLLYATVPWLRSHKGVITSGFVYADAANGLEQRWRPVLIANESTAGPSNGEGNSPFLNADSQIGTWLTEAAAARARRDVPGSGSPDAPLPVDGSSNPPPSTPNYDSNGNGDGVFASPGVDFDSDAVNLAEFQEDPDCFELMSQWVANGSQGERPMCGPISDVVNYECLNYLWGSRGYFVGLTGAAHYGANRAQDHLGYMGAICAPWSVQPWSDHWSFLRVVTRAWFEQLGTPARSAWQGWLYDYLRRAYVALTPAQTNGGAEYPVRPVPMKMCPPNYALSAMRAAIDRTNENQHHVLGVLRLRCVRVVNRADIPQQLEVHMSPPNGEPRHTLTLQGTAPRIYPLRQDIGQVDEALHPQDNYQKWIGCDSNSVLTALQVHTVRDADRVRITGMFPACNPRPQ